jgi:hypothetical protein
VHFWRRIEHGGVSEFVGHGFVSRES